MSIENDLKQQLTDISEKQRTAWEAYKATHDQKLKEIAEKGATQAVVDEALGKINADLDAYGKKHQEVLDQLKSFQESCDEKFDELEAAAKRPPPSKDDPKDDTAERTRKAFCSYLTYGSAGLDVEERKLLKPGVEGDLTQKVLTQGDDTGGGYLAPAEFVQEIIKGVIEFSPLRSLARVIPTSRGAVRIPKRTATFAAQWVSEVGTRSETTGLAYGTEEIPNHEMYALVDISNQNIEDSAFNLESELRGEFAEQFGVAEGTAFITGNAVGKPQGITVKATDHTATGTTNTVAADDLIDVAHKLKEAYFRNSTWLMKRTQIANIRQLKDSQNQYLWIPGFEANPSTILGRPLREATDLELEGSSGNIVALLGDYRRAYVISDRVQIAVMRDPFTQATAGATRFIARKRVGGQTVLAEAVYKITA